MIGRGTVRNAKKLTSLFNSGVKTANPSLKHTPINHAAHTMRSNPAFARTAYANAWGGKIMGPGMKSSIGSGGITFNPYKRAARGMNITKAMAGKGKYAAGAVAGGYAVGGITRNTTGSTKAVGRSTGIYGY